jgi:hypothetical protein
MSKKHQKPWFKPVRGSYLPNSWQGWLTYIPFIYWLAVTFVVIDRHTHSVGETIIGIVPFWVSGVVVMHWVAKATSKKS